MYVNHTNTTRNNIFAQPNVANPSSIAQSSIVQYGQNQSGFMQQQNSSIMQQQQQQYSQQLIQQNSIMVQQQQFNQQNPQIQQFQQQNLQQVQPDLNQQQQINVDPNAVPTNYAMYGQQQQIQPLFVIPEDYTNPDAIPQKIDFQFYGIIERTNYIKAYLLLRFQNWQILFHCNHVKRLVAESEAKIIVKNFIDFSQLEFDSPYFIYTEEGFWIIKISDLDRVYMVFYDVNFRKDLAFQNFEEYYKMITEQEQLVKVQNNVELFNSVILQLQQLTEQFEQRLLENKETNLFFDLEKCDFSQTSYQIGLSQQCLINQVEKLKLKTLNNQIHPAFQGTNLINDLRLNIQPIVSICICILLILIVILLLYNYVIKDVIQAQQTQSNPKKHVIINFRNS